MRDVAIFQLRSDPFTTIKLPDDFRDIFEFLKMNSRSETECITAMDYAINIRHQALVLGLDPQNNVSKHLESTLYRCAVAYSNTPQAWDIVRIGWGVENVSASSGLFGANFINPNSVKNLFVQCLLPFEGDAIDLRSIEEVQKVKNSSGQFPSAKHNHIRTIIERILDNPSYHGFSLS